MPRLRARPGPPPEDTCELSMDADETRSHCLRRKCLKKTSPLSKYIEAEHQQAGLFSLSSVEAIADLTADLQKRKRKKCGACIPCLRKENCDACSNCLNRRTRKQICKERKCEQLKKRQSEGQESEVGHFEDNSQGCVGPLELAAETVHKVTTVDGLTNGGQMETGSHDRLQEGTLSQELANGVNPYRNHDEASMEKDEERAGNVAERQCWVQANSKIKDTQQQQSGWSSSGGTTSPEGIHHADLEDAQNLVAFSSTASSYPPSSSSSCLVVQPNTAQLYEKFTQETCASGAHSKVSAGASETSYEPLEDLDILQTALSQAKHGHKPPNCNCDGPGCPDYLEWLEKKIKLATRREQGSHKIDEEASHLEQPHVQHQPPTYQQVNGTHHIATSCLQQRQEVNQYSHQDQVPSSKPPIPCSPQVLSIAKEKNISLQTALAIDALTQLSSPQTVGSLSQTLFRNNLHNHQNSQNITPSSLNGNPSSRSQSVPPGLHTNQQAPASYEHHRPQSQGQPANTCPLPSSTSPFPSQEKDPDFSPNPQQWRQGSDRDSGKRNQWMYIKPEPHSHFVTSPPNSSDPMSELKQLLGDTKFKNASFNLPLTQQLNMNHNGGIQVQGSQGLVRIKPDPDSGEHHTSSTGHYGLTNGQQQGQHYPGNPMSHGQTVISNSTQAALQQHLHYKRKLFSTHSSSCGAPDPRTPITCQNLKKWWPHMDAEGLSLLPIKQEPKKRKNSQGSPVMKSMGGMLIGPPLPKPKQIIIKKNKQKASMPTFIPQAQIAIQKPPVQMMDKSLSLTKLQICSLPSLALLSNSAQASAAGLPAPEQSQVSISNTSPTPSSNVTPENAPALVDLLSTPVVPAAIPKSEEGGINETSTNTSNATPVTSTTPSCTSQLQKLVNIDPKYEELIRQFEAEFGDPDMSASQHKEKLTPTPTQENQSPISHQNLSLTPSNTAQSVPSIPTPQANTTPHSDNQKMEVSKTDSDTQTELTVSQPSKEGSLSHQHTKLVDVSLNHETILGKQLLQQRMLEDALGMQDSPLPKRIKIENSGDLAILSTTCFSAEGTAIKDGLNSSPSLKGFLDSPLCYLDTPTKNLLDTPIKDPQSEFPTCTCVEQISEKDEGPYYNHLGSGPTVASIRTLMEMRYGQKGEAVRIEKVVYTGKEGKSSHGCPIAKWVIRRSSEKEKLLCLVRQRAGHHCANAVIIVVILAWEGVPRVLADKLYHEVTNTLTKYGNPTSRRCGLNDDRTCACQGKDSEKCGASFSFGCSWSMYFNGCKYARSKTPRKFRLQGDHPEEEEKLRDNFQNLATEVAPLYKRLAPQAYTNQCAAEQRAPECRLGLKEGRPFSGITACMDFCAHAHKDQHNLHNGCTVVCTLTKEDNRKVGEIPEDEQLHVLPLYTVSLTDEFGSAEAQRRKMQNGAIQVLQAFRREVRKLPEPAKSCRQRRLEAKKAASEKKKSKLAQQAGETPEKTVVKPELCITSSPHPPANKEMMNQDTKPNIKIEPLNGSRDGYPVQATDPFNNIYQNPAYYARGAHSPAGQPSAADTVNGYHPNLPAMPYGYYNYPPNALFPRKLRTYEGRSKPGQADRKFDAQSPQGQMLQSSNSHPEQNNQQNNSVNTQHANYNVSRPSSVSSEPSDRGLPPIKKEPMDVPVYEGALPSHACANTSRSTPPPVQWPGYKINGSLVSNNWDGPLKHRESPDVSSFNADKQQFHQHAQQHQSSPYSQQWISLPCSNLPIASNNPTLQVPASPPPSPHRGTGLQGNLYQGSICHGTPYPGTPQPVTSHSGSVTPKPGTPRPGTPVTGLPGPPTPGPGTPGQVTPRHWASPAPSPQPNPWGMGPAAYSPGLKHSNPAGAYPDKIWSKTGENRCSTPLGLQEKAWKSCGGSLAGSTPSPAPEGRLFPDALQQSDLGHCDPFQAESDVESSKHREEDEVWSDSEHNFLDPTIGGVAIAPAHGSVLIECARRELHATTPLKKPDRTHPTRISLVFYQHKNLNQPMHGLAVWEAKMKLLAERALQRQQEAALLGLSQEDIKALGKKRKWGSMMAGTSPGPGQSKDKKDGPVTRLCPTFYTTSMVTVSPYAFTSVTGPYSHFV